MQIIILNDSKELKEADIKNNLINLYDVLNVAISKLKDKDKDKYFLSNKRIEELKKNKNIRFI